MINLLPPKQKEELLEEEKYKLVLVLGILVLLFLVSFALVMFSVKIYIEREYTEIQKFFAAEEKKFNKQEFEELKNKVKLLNGKLEDLNSFYRQQSDLIGIFEKISVVLPSRIALNQVSLNKTPEKAGQYEFFVSVSGFSPTREKLLEFKKSLEAEEQFKEVFFPPSTWVKSNDIDFNLTFKIKSGS